jgi:hypothetical protein
VCVFVLTLTLLFFFFTTLYLSFARAAWIISTLQSLIPKFVELSTEALYALPLTSTLIDLSSSLKFPTSLLNNLSQTFKAQKSKENHILKASILLVELRLNVDPGFEAEDYEVELFGKGDKTGEISNLIDDVIKRNQGNVKFSRFL